MHSRALPTSTAWHEPCLRSVSAVSRRERARGSPRPAVLIPALLLPASNCLPLPATVIVTPLHAPPQPIASFLSPLRAPARQSQLAGNDFAAALHEFRQLQAELAPWLRSSSGGSDIGSSSKASPNDETFALKIGLESHLGELGSRTAAMPMTPVMDEGTADRLQKYRLLRRRLLMDTSQLRQQLEGAMTSADTRGPSSRHTVKSAGSRAAEHLSSALQYRRTQRQGRPPILGPAPVIVAVLPNAGASSQVNIVPQMSSTATVTDTVLLSPANNQNASTSSNLSECMADLPASAGSRIRMAALAASKYREAMLSARSQHRYALAVAAVSSDGVMSHESSNSGVFSHAQPAADVIEAAAVVEVARFDVYANRPIRCHCD